MPGLDHNNVIPDSAADFDLFDRVVMAKQSHSVSVLKCMKLRVLNQHLKKKS